MPLADGRPFISDDPVIMAMADRARARQAEEAATLARIDAQHRITCGDLAEYYRLKHERLRRCIFGIKSEVADARRFFNRLANGEEIPLDEYAATSFMLQYAERDAAAAGGLLGDIAATVAKLNRTK